ncbi:MAG: hypothetical protein WB985_02665 [Candidatus Acidiferrales bacterium]
METLLANQDVETKPRLELDGAPKLVATPFGKLTEEEVHQWEQMLGRPLLRL